MALEALGLEKYFERVTFAQELGLEKRKPDVWLQGHVGHALVIGVGVLHPPAGQELPVHLLPHAVGVGQRWSWRRTPTPACR